MKRFTVEEDREFEIGGELFQWVYPYWEDIADVFDSGDMGEETNGNAPLTVRGTIQDFIDKIELFIDSDFNDGISRWREISKRKKNPIPHSQYAQLYQWLLEVTSGTHPTEPSSQSETGQPAAAAT